MRHESLRAANDFRSFLVFSRLVTTTKHFFLTCISVSQQFFEIENGYSCGFQARLVADGIRSYRVFIVIVSNSVLVNLTFTLLSAMDGQCCKRFVKYIDL
jgi:hypothetical protein